MNIIIEVLLTDLSFIDFQMPKPKLKFLKLSAENGKKLLAFKVFSEAIKFLKNHFEGLLKKSTVSEGDGHSSRLSSSAENGNKSKKNSNSLKYKKNYVVSAGNKGT